MQPVEIQQNPYVMDSSNKFVDMRAGGRGNQCKILKFEDDTEWVYLPNSAQERFCGFLYLENAIKESHLEKVKAAENKMAIHNRKIIYLSRYRGEEKLSFLTSAKYAEEIGILKEQIGFTDLTNLRVQGAAVYVFDTEKMSFSENVHEQMDAFIHQHDALRASLEELLRNEQEQEQKQQ